MNAQEVDFSALNALAIKDHSHGDARDETNKLAFATYSNDPISVVVRGHQSPPEEGD